jgi:hypothetical protein
MAEFSKARGIIINGREQNGRTYQRDDGTYESLDLKDVRRGEMVTVLTDDGAHDLVKADDKEHGSALEGWCLGTTAVRLSLSEPAGNGAHFIHYGIVLRERLGLQVSYPASERPNVVYGLGTIASIVSLRAVGEPAPQYEPVLDK